MAVVGLGCPVRVPWIPDAYLAQVDEDQPDEAVEATADSSPVGIIAVGLVIGLLVAGAVILLTRDGDETATAPPPTVAAPTTTDSGLSDDNAENGDAVDLVVAYGRSRTDTHALVGQLLRPDSPAVPVRRAIMGDRAIDEAGVTAAVTEEGETRQCELIDDQWLCAPPLPAFTADLDVQGFATLFLTEQPTYSVFAVRSEPPDSLQDITDLGPVTCWSFVSDGRVDRARFGAETTMCFHDELGALVGQVTETSVGNNVFIASRLSADVDVADVEPSR